MLLVKHVVWAEDRNGGEVTVPDSQDKSDSPTHRLQGKQKMTSRQQIETMKDAIRKQAGQVSSTTDTRLFSYIFNKQRVQLHGNSHG